MGIHRTRSFQNSESDPERHAEQNDNKKFKHSKSVPTDMESQYIFRMESISQFAEEEPLQADSYRWPSDASFFGRYRARDLDTYRRSSHLSLLSRITGMSIMSLVSAYRSSRNVFLIISVSLSIAIVIIVLVLMTL